MFQPGVGSRVACLILLFSGMLALSVRADTGVIQIAKLLAPDGAENELFGSDVAKSGDVIVVGCPNRDRLGQENAGTVFVYRMIEGVPVLEAELTPKQSTPIVRFGRSVEVDGDRILVADLTHLYVFRHDGMAWAEEQVLRDDRIIGGEPMAIWRDRIAIANELIIGFPEFFIIADLTMYFHNGESWIFEDFLFDFGPEFLGAFGQDIAMNDEYIAVGISFFINDKGIHTGAVRIYRRSSTSFRESWTLTQTIVPDDAARDDEFGVSIDMTEDRLIIGSWRTDGAVIRSGGAYVYKLNIDQWEFEQKLIDPESESGDFFGLSVAFDDDYAIIGAPAGNRIGLGIPAGYARIFRYDGEGWAPKNMIVASEPGLNDLFGEEVEIDGAIAVVGTRRDDDLGRDSGSVWVFDICGADINHDGIIDTADLGALLANFGTNEPLMDYNADGIIDVVDLGVLLSEFGSNCP